MAYVVTDKCIRCKFMDCVSVCPVDCFHEGENMLVINPDACIDCGVCEPECPAAAIAAEGAPEAQAWIALNAQYADVWPNIAEKKEPPADASEWMNVDGKFESAFSAAPGQPAPAQPAPAQSAPVQSATGQA